MRVLLIGNKSETIILFREKVINLLVSKGMIVTTLTMDCDEVNFEKIRNMGLCHILMIFLVQELILFLILFIPIVYPEKSENLHQI